VLDEPVGLAPTQANQRFLTRKQRQYAGQALLKIVVSSNFEYKQKEHAHSAEVKHAPEPAGLTGAGAWLTSGDSTTLGSVAIPCVGTKALSGADAEGIKMSPPACSSQVSNMRIAAMFCRVSTVAECWTPPVFLLATQLITGRADIGKVAMAGMRTLAAIGKIEVSR
jgi:hypothetical protein